MSDSIISSPEHLSDETKAKVKEEVAEMAQLEELIFNYIDGKETDIHIFLQNNNFTNDPKKMDILVRIFNRFIFSEVRKERIDKVFELILSLRDEIEKLMTKERISVIFWYNSCALLFLYQNKILIDIQPLIKVSDFFDSDFCFLLPEIYEYSVTEFNKLVNRHNMKKKKRIFDTFIKDNFCSFKEKRKEYHSDNEIAKAIRNDDINAFIDYFERTNSKLSSPLPDSPFEILKNHSSIMDYACVSGSIQIFKYLYNNNIKVKNNLLLSSIIGRNYEIFHIIEEKLNADNSLSTNIISDNHFIANVIESYRNEFFDYIRSTYGDEVTINQSSFTWCINSYNYIVFQKIIEAKPELLDNAHNLDDICKNNYLVCLSK